MIALDSAVAPAAVPLQTRGIDGLSALREGLPPWGLEAFAAVTYLGDPLLLLLLAVAVYLARDRRAGAVIAGALFVGFALTIGLKAWFALPRPPSELGYVAEAGFGFPSGHAIGATIGWGALALTLDRVGTRLIRSTVAGAVIVAVALSRVAIGVHYLVDVVVGIGIGIAVLTVSLGWLDDEPLWLFVLATALAGAAVGVTGGGLEAIVLLGACLGTATSWQAVEPTDRPWGRRGLAVWTGGTVVVGAGMVAVGPTAALAFGGGAGLAAVAVVGLPAGERWLVGVTSD